ncbi:Zinc finger protein ZAT9 [Carex littledalei]|uniref:Zinc finger protein ZAT9 n=1 Tax=Carex littledalei TaxID=544730 RepID=A0A833RSU9_9POAL|nr:Zinc finger protein ZAT9 [Carex littledalei]
MMESLKEEVKFSCKVCEQSFPSGPALGGHMRRHFSGNLNKKTKSDFGKLEEEVALALIALKMSGSRKSELLEIDIPESGAEEAASKSLSVEMWPKDREKIQVTDPAPEEKEKIVASAKKRKMADTDVLLPDLKRVVYECNTCHRTFRSQQALGGHRSGQMRGRTCKKEDIESKAVPARFNCDGYILKRDVVWAKRRRSAKVFISYFVRN